MEKLNPFLLRSLTFMTLVAATFGFVIGVNWHSHQSSQGTIKTEKTIIQPSSLEPVHPEIVPHLEGKALHQQSLVQTSKSLFPVNPKQAAIAPPLLDPKISQHQIIPTKQVLNATPRDSLDNLSEENPAKTFWVPLEFQSKIVKKITPVEQKKVIALTFDDGPWPENTVKILHILNKNKIKATFFWVGQAVKDHPQLAQQVVAEGHAIGNHTWHHWYRKLNSSTAAHEIDDTAELIYKTTGVKTSLFRPPGGVMNNGVGDYAKQKKFVIVMWSNDPMDYRPLSANQLVNNVMRKAEPGAIVLMHDGGGNHAATVQALPQIITKLTQQGYKFVTIPELMEMSDPKGTRGVAQKG